MTTVLILNNDSMGHGDSALGHRILKTLLQKSGALTDLTAICLYNAGVKLLAPDSPVLAELTLIQENGVDLLPCGTCLKHYGLTPPGVDPSTMDTILAEVDGAAKVVTI
ncbi:MAG: DsrE family protein [Planctomycetota bacterium]|nr:DsrE family protein [Planctomycetota bacterium]